MADANVFHPTWDRDMPDLGLRAVRLGPLVGSVELGVSLFELDPGGAASPIHLHYGNEELLVVLSGHPQLRTPDGMRVLEPGAIVSFPRGPGGAHQIANTADEPARVLVFSTMNYPEITELVTSGTTFITTAPDARKTFPGGASADFMALWRAAFETDRP